MGGNAFHALLPDATFPRIPPAAYQTIKTRLTPLVQQFYEQVSVPREAPEKTDYGDLDFVVCGLLPERSLEALGAAMGAAKSILVDKGICNFAIPVRRLDCEDALPSMDENAFFQVDVQVCANVQEWESYVYYSSYGDLGMILGTMTRNSEMILGHSGLRLANVLPTSPPLTFRLTSSFPDIFAFLGLSVERWVAGFTTQLEIFEWVASSPFFDAQRLCPRGTSPNTSRQRARDVRPMFQRFLQFVQLDDSLHRFSRPGFTSQEAVDKALAHFGRRALYDFLLHVAEVKKHAKTIFTGKLVEEWTGLKGMSVRLVMDEIRRKLGGTETLPVTVSVDVNIEPVHITLVTWEETLFGMSSDTLRQLVMDTKQEMDMSGKLEFDWREAKKLSVERKTAEKMHRA